MTVKEIFDTMGLLGALVLPLFNIPLIVNIVKRKSSDDISMTWALGVYSCLLLMAPSSYSSADFVWRAFNLSNLALFSVVVFVIFKYRKRKKP